MAEDKETKPAAEAAASSKLPSPPSSLDKSSDTSGPAASSEAPSSPSPADKSSGTSGSKGDSSRFYSIHRSIQKNIETVNFVTKEIDKMNDRILFHSKTLTPAEESTLIQKVSHLHKDTSMKLRDTSRLIKNLRREAVKPTDEPGCKKRNDNEEKSEDEEKDEEEGRDKGEKEDICKTISRSFTDELLLYQSSIQDFKNELKERLTKQVQSIRPKASEDFVDLSLRSESNRYALFREIMAADEKDLSEEDAKKFKDEIAEKYVVIAQLSMGAKEMNQIFLNLASTSHASLSDSDEDSDKATRRSSSTRRSIRNPFASSKSGNNAVDDLLGDINRAAATADQYYASTGSLPSTTTRSSSKEGKIDADSSPTSHHGGSPRGARRNRLFAFMSRHRNASTASAKNLRLDTSDVRTVSKRRRGRRWMTLFLLATVAVAAMYGVLMLY